MHRRKRIVKLDQVNLMNEKEVNNKTIEIQNNSNSHYIWHKCLLNLWKPMVRPRTGSLYTTRMKSNFSNFTIDRSDIHTRFSIFLLFGVLTTKNSNILPFALKA